MFKECIVKIKAELTQKNVRGINVDLIQGTEDLSKVVHVMGQKDLDNLQRLKFAPVMNTNSNLHDIVTRTMDHTINERTVRTLEFCMKQMVASRIAEKL